MKNWKDYCIDLLRKRGVELERIAEAVYELQIPHIKTVTIEECLDSVHHVLAKREVQLAIMTGIEIDIMAEKRLMENKILEQVILTDQSLYGVDEVLAYGICNLYGSIALTNFGFIDKIKFGIVKELNDVDESKVCNTFIDDIVGAIAAAAASRFAHRNPGGDNGNN